MGGEHSGAYLSFSDLILNQEKVDIPELWARPFRVLGDSVRMNRCPRIGVDHMAYGLIEESITDLQAHPGVAHHVAVPAAFVGKRPALVVGGEQIEVAFKEGAVSGNGMRNQVGRAGLNEDQLVVFRERPISNRLGYPVPS